MVRITSTPLLDEARPVAGNGYLAWARSSVRHPNRYATYVRRGRGRAMRVNPPGTQAIPGAISGHTLVYHQTGKTTPGRSNVKFFDLRTLRRYDPPAGVNTGAWEGFPSLSGGWLVFLRVEGETGTWLARHLRTAETIVIRRRDGGCVSTRGQLISRSQVRGRWVAFQGCVPGRYDLELRRLDSFEFGGVATLAWHSPSVASDGTLHYVSYSEGFGPSPVHMSRRPAKTSTRAPYQDVLVLPPGEMVRSTYVAGDAVYFDRNSSPGTPADLYRLDP